MNEDYALLIGSVGLFLILAAIMYATRRVDWYAGQWSKPSNKPLKLPAMGFSRAGGGF